MVLLAVLTWLDHAVIVVCLAAMIGLGMFFSRRQRTEDEYFLAGRRMPWLIVGISIIASLLSSLTYVSEPGEVWKSGITHMAGKMVAIPFEMIFVWVFCIPYLMRFRLTSAYEYLDLRFGPRARQLGTTLFVLLVVSWMGFVVLASSRVLADVSGMSLGAVIATVGLVSTLYTYLGGLRGVIWTDVLQVALLIGGALFIVIYVGVQTDSNPADWYRETLASDVGGLPWASFNPFERATILTVAVHMFVWHICTHTANQMTVQRYLSTPSLRSARRSFVVGSVLGVAINLLLTVLGLALFYFYHAHPDRLPSGLDPAQGHNADRIFPLFISHELPPGVAGAVIMALMAAAMSSIDSGINSLATVLTIERHYLGDRQRTLDNQVGWAKVATGVMGVSITGAAYLLDQLTRGSNIIEMMPRSFNCFTGALGGMFFIGIFLPRAGSRSVVPATLCGLATAIGLAYSNDLFDLAQPVSFTWVMPGSLLVTVVTGWLLGRCESASSRPLPGLTWYTRHEMPQVARDAATDE